MRIDVITLFPEMFDAVARHGIARRALEEGRWQLRLWNPRDFVSDNHRTIDDRPYGGGPGMVMLAEPLAAAIAAARASQTEGGVGEPLVVYLSPQGQPLTQALVRRWAGQGSDGVAGQQGLILLAGRYEGIDERLLQTEVDREVSIGDYVLSGGELPSMVLIDALVRLLPGVLNDAESAVQESFSAGLLDWPHYTRPERWRDLPVPPVLLSGNHAAIQRWRHEQAQARTQERRPDLLAGEPNEKGSTREPLAAGSKPRQEPGSI